MAVLELAKASPGILGAVLEFLRDPKIKAAKPAVLKIPFVGTLRKEATGPAFRSKMMTMLQWKSVAAAFNDLSNDELSSSTAFAEFARSPDVSYVAQVAGSEDGTRALETVLPLSRVEPMFLAASLGEKNGSEFGRFLIQLTGYSIAVLHEDTTNQNDINKNLILNRFESSETKITTTKKMNLEFRGILGYFYEDAVATGILFQTE